VRLNIPERGQGFSGQWQEGFQNISYASWRIQPELEQVGRLQETSFQEDEMIRMLSASRYLEGNLLA
jgi:hypothetical protein